MKKIFNKKVMLGIIVMIVIFLVYFLSHNVSKLPNQQNNRQQAIDTNINTKDWLLYENKNLGVSMEYPKQIMGQDIVFFQIGSMLIVTTSNSSIYTHRNEITATDPISIKNKILEMKQKYNTQYFEEGWQIWVSDVNTDKDLSNIIQKWFGDYYGFGNGCKFGGKSEIPNQKNYYNINVDAVKPGYDMDSSSCGINWGVNFVYSSEYRKAAIWDRGQENHFYLNYNCVYNANGDNCSADELMGESFRFITK